MTLAVLILTVCLVGDPTSCREERPALEPLSALACLIAGQIEAAKWVDEHPKYRLDRWRCEPAGRGGRAA